MFIPALTGRQATELGHPNYQHPKRSERDFHVQLDDFACRSIQISLQALALAPELIVHCDNSLLLKRADYEAPTDSEVGRTLERLALHDPALRTDLDGLWEACGGRPPRPQVVAPTTTPAPPSAPRPRTGGGLWYTQTEADEPLTSPAPVAVGSVPPAAASAFPAPLTLADYRQQLVTIPAGEFLRGSIEHSDEKPVQTLRLAEFQIGKTPVTVGMYQEFVRANPAYKSSWAQRPGQMPLAPAGGVWNGRWFGCESHPMVNVSWDDALAFARWAGMALPTEAQWEKAARGTDGRRFPWGSGWSEGNAHTSKRSLGDVEGTAPVGSSPRGASPYGVLDMVGNVWEWCADWYHPDAYKSAPSSDPTGPSTGTERVLRGGSWRNFLPADFRCTNRERSQPEVKNILVGFRLVRK